MTNITTYGLQTNKAMSLKASLRKAEQGIDGKNKRVRLSTGLRKMFIKYLCFIEEAYEWLEPMSPEEKWTKYPHVIGELRRGIDLLASLHEKFNVGKKEKYNHAATVIELAKERIDNVDKGKAEEVSE